MNFTVAFEKCFTEWHKDLLSFATNRIGDKMQAEDIVQNTFAKLWKEKEKLQDGSNIKGWLFTTVRNACFDEFRKRTRDLKVFDPRPLEEIYDQGDPFFDSEQIRVEVLKMITAGMEKLPPQCLKVMQLMFVEGLTKEQTAEQLNISPRTVQNHKLKGLNFLRDNRDERPNDQFFIFILIALMVKYSAN